MNSSPRSPRATANSSRTERHRHRRPRRGGTAAARARAGRAARRARAAAGCPTRGEREQRAGGAREPALDVRADPASVEPPESPPAGAATGGTGRSAPPRTHQRRRSRPSAISTTAPSTNGAPKLDEARTRRAAPRRRGRRGVGRSRHSSAPSPALDRHQVPGVELPGEHLGGGAEDHEQAGGDGREPAADAAACVEVEERDDEQVQAEREQLVRPHRAEAEDLEQQLVDERVGGHQVPVVVAEQRLPVPPAAVDDEPPVVGPERDAARRVGHPSDGGERDGRERELGEERATPRRGAFRHSSRARPQRTCGRKG